jgi:ORF6N domain
MSLVAKPNLPVDSIERHIHMVRGQKVMLDSDLAALYEVPTKLLNQAVRRNQGRFPEDFMFQLSKDESAALRLQFATSNGGRGGRRYLPYAFTEHGVAMLSSVIKSERAIQVHVMIIRAFVRMRELIALNKDIAVRVDKLERSHKRAASVIEILVEDIDRVAKEVRQMKASPRQENETSVSWGSCRERYYIRFTASTSTTRLRVGILNVSAWARAPRRVRARAVRFSALITK